MRVVGYILLVSTFLIYDGVGGTLTTSLTSALPCVNKETPRFSVKNKQTLIRQFWSGCNTQPSFGEVNPRNILTATLTSLNNSLKSSVTNFKDNMFNSLANNFVDVSDDLKEFDEVTSDIYESTLSLLVLKFQIWMTKGERLEKIFNYLGYPEEIISIINASITELLYQQRKTNKKMSNLISAFYYLCDIEHVRDGNDKTDSENVKKTYKSLLKKFDLKEQDVLKMNETDLVKFLTEKLDSITEKVNSAFGASISSMKNRILLDISENKIINVLKNRFIANKGGLHETLHTLARSCEKETVDWKVTANHLILIGKLTLEVFSFVYNHIDLLSKLRMYDLDKTDIESIMEFSTFTDKFMSIFVDRYFEFKGKVNEEFVNEIFPLVYFFNPTDLAPNPNSNFVVSKEGDVLSISDYHDASKRKSDRFDDYLRDLLNTSLKIFLETFSGEDVEEWKNNRSFKINYDEGEHDKEYYLSIMKTNTNEAFETLNLFYKNFEV